MNITKMEHGDSYLFISDNWTLEMLNFESVRGEKEKHYIFHDNQKLPDRLTQKDWENNNFLIFDTVTILFEFCKTW